MAKEQTVQLNVKVPVADSDWLENEAKAPGVTQRSLVSEAIEILRDLRSGELRVVCAGCQVEQTIERQGDLYAGVLKSEQKRGKARNKQKGVIVLESSRVTPELRWALEQIIAVNLIPGGENVVERLGGTAEAVVAQQEA